MTYTLDAVKFKWMHMTDTILVIIHCAGQPPLPMNTTLTSPPLGCIRPSSVKEEHGIYSSPRLNLT
jgi:hypothetical protein